MALPLAIEATHPDTRTTEHGTSFYHAFVAMPKVRSLGAYAEIVIQ
jgi:hypothetical protein